MFDSYGVSSSKQILIQGVKYNFSALSRRSEVKIRACDICIIQDEITNKTDNKL